MFHASPPHSLSPALTAFLHQIADPSLSDEPLSYTYAASIILPGTQWAPEEFMERLFDDLSEAATYRAIEQAEEKILAGDLAPFSFALTARGGMPVYFLALPRASLTPQGGNTVLLALAAQPSATQRPLHPFGRENAIFKLLDVLPAYVLLLTENNDIFYMNRAANQLFGLSEGQKCYNVLQGQDTPCKSCKPFTVFFTNTIQIHDWVSTRTNTAFRAHSYPFSAADGKQYILQVGINITAGIRARHALGISEQRYRSIAENLTMGLALVDADLNVVTVNPRMMEWFGVSTAKGAPIRNVLPNPLCDCVFDDVLSDKKTHETEFRLPLASGEERQFRLVACPMLTRTQKLRAMVILLEDVTERRTMAARLQQIQRIEALGTLAGGIAHEINQPLSALHLYASGLQMLLEKGESTPPSRVMERLELILAQADKIKQIISHMRSLVMQEENPLFSPVSVAQAVSGALGLVGTQLCAHEITVSIDIPANLPSCSANAVQLEQVVINLLVNAMHALDAISGRDKTIDISAEQKDEMVVLRVTDNGPGVGDLRMRIFDPFFSTKESQQGMGLGLSIAHTFVSSWGGTIDAKDNSAGFGATFTVSLPIATHR